MRIIDGKLFKEMVITGATVLHNNHPEIDALNVFPVPDGDTGTNMGMTIENGAKEVSDRSASTVGEAAGIFAKGLLMGARGNSGVITSQLFRGFSQSVKDKENWMEQRLQQPCPRQFLPLCLEKCQEAFRLRLRLHHADFSGHGQEAVHFKRFRSSNSVCMI